MDQWSGRPRNRDDRAMRRLIQGGETIRRKAFKDLTWSRIYKTQAPTKISRTTIKQRLKFIVTKGVLCKKKLTSQQNKIRRRPVVVESFT